MVGRRTRSASREGQATPEYVGLVLLVATVLGALLTLAGPALLGGEVARALAAKLVCAVRQTGRCGAQAAELAARPSPTERAYGPEVAAMIAERAPTISFEDDDFVSLPVDYRECRRRACADSIRHGAVGQTQAGLQPTVFTHVVDCRDPGAAGAEGYDCAGGRAGNVYVQYWLYYPDSETRGLGRVGGYHLDDWESYQVRIDGSGGAVARASSHHGYNGRSGGLDSIGSDTGKSPKPGWDTILDQLHVASGSHAGMSQNGAGDSRRIDPGSLRFVPLEPIARASDAPGFAVSPPWEKGVWRDPESTGT